MFEQILLDLHAALDRARILIKEYESKLRDVNDREKDTVALHHKLQEQSISMEAREAECQKIENIQQLHKDATARHDAANLAVNASAEAKKDLDRRVAEENSKLDQKRLLLAQEAKNNEKRVKQIDDEVSKRVGEVLKGMGIKQ